MKINLLAGLIIALPLVLVGCGKKDAPAQAASSEQTATTTSTEVTPEQQAAIDSLDKPNPEAIKVEGESASGDVAASAAN
ncbi:hypothetical protein F4V57_04340 [Acinetobacter qingfengensis]|uniref:Uncharacterized protein n=1 Tax=Acinetobacter qingfengensis TaxID=1262585 RepID=A0A1E7REJ1_9GAMM|nr:hypothetical protein [Acinetobacter qingfengensis]KAA8734991.1 hypothetical protein F4V57_04340 [Acinetobacter qingfengensis]OEY97713.1 hypothetical protein BJI46_08135 [Acinetobacter qingfengensis]